MPEPITIDVWSDIACPWCYIGKHNLQVALDAYATTPGALDISVELHSYELAPDTPVDYEGSELDFVTAHYGKSAAEVQPMLERVRNVASDAGLVYNFDAVQHANTGKAHQLLHLAKTHGLQLEMADRLFQAYFVDGGRIGHDDELAELAADVGVDRTEVLEALRDGTYAAAVDADKAEGAGYGIRGVPFFVVDGKYGLSGAQPPATFEQVLTQVVEERSSDLQSG